MKRHSAMTMLAVIVAAGCERSSPQASAPADQTKGGAVTQPAPEKKPAAPAWNAIPGGKEVRFAGASAHVPGDWMVVPQGNATLISPPDANRTMLEEIYGFIGEPTMRSLDHPQLEQYLDMSVSQLLQVPAQRRGPGEPTKVGALDGKAWVWTARLMDGRDIEVRAWGFVGSYAGSFVAISTPAILQRRGPSIEAIRSSIHKPEAAAISSARLVGTWVRAFGGGSVLIGNANEQRITFDGAGRFHYHSEGTSHGLFHNSSSQTDITGSWRLNGDQLTGIADTGETATFTLEARAESGTGAAVIAIDGTEFRQADGRPW